MINEFPQVGLSRERVFISSLLIAAPDIQGYAQDYEKSPYTHYDKVVSVKHFPVELLRAIDNALIPDLTGL